jgi:hypothetical protein
MKSPSIRSNSLAALALLAVLFIFSAGVVPAQFILTDLGPTPPAPGPNDIAQLSSDGDEQFPGGLNYYSNNGNGSPGPAGQTFTTGSNPNGYVLTSVTFKSGGLDGTSTAPFTDNTYRLQIYQLTNATSASAALLNQTTPSTYTYGAGDWLQLSGFTPILLSNNTTYAYTIRMGATTSWDDLAEASGNPYAGGEICRIPSAGGTVTFGTNNSFDATFVIGLSLTPVAVAPTATPNPANALSLVTLTANAAGPGTLTYQWRTDGGTGGSLTNIPGATSNVFSMVPPNTGADYSINYDVIVTSSTSGSVTSPPVAVTVRMPVIYSEGFTVSASAAQIATMGWRSDTEAADARIYTTGTNRAVYSFSGTARGEAFYVTTVTGDGSYPGHQAFPSINLATTANMRFNVDLNSGWQPALVHSFFAIQINWSDWYVSTTELLPTPTGTFANYSLDFDPSAFGWNQLTVSSSGTVGNANFPAIGEPAVANLSGYITGAGLVCIHDGSSTHNFDNFSIFGTIPPPTKPVINSPPFSQTNYSGATATFAVSAVATNGTGTDLSYQWRAGTIGSGVYSDLSEGGRFSGTTSNTLRIANVSTADQKDYVVRVFDTSGSVTSVPPARLTVVSSAPLLVADTAISPNAVHAGNNNIINISASMTGSEPLLYQWRFSTNADGSFAANVAGATNSTYTLSNPQESHSGYYSLRGSNVMAPNILDSAWAQLTVSPASNAYFHWSAPVPLVGMTAAEILGVPGSLVGAAHMSGSGGTVTNGSTIYNFTTDGSVASMSGVAGPGTGTGTWISFHTTGNTDFDAILDQVAETGGTPQITLHGLTPGSNYSVQLFSLNNNHDPGRAQAFADPNDLTDVSLTYKEGDNAYIIGTFVADQPDVPIQQVLPTGHGYFGSLIVREVVPIPTLSFQRSGPNQLQLTWDFGTLLEATTVSGPWTTNPNTSPFTLTPTGLQKFFRVQSP